MKANTYFLFLFLFSSVVSLFGQQNFQLLSAEMTIEGTSTLHDWVSSVEQFSAKAAIERTDNKLVTITALQVRIPVKEIKSTKGRIMDNKTYDALQADEHPNILFKLNKMALKDGKQLNATGQLTIAGKSKTVQFPVEYTLKPGAKIQFTGAYTLKMTDYEVAPPTAVLGTIKTGDEVTVRFTCVLGPAGTAAETK